MFGIETGVAGGFVLLVLLIVGLGLSCISSRVGRRIHRSLAGSKMSFR